MRRTKRAFDPFLGGEWMPRYAHDWLCRQIVEDCQDAIIFADRDGVIRLWNSGAETTFGYRPEEALGQTLDLIIPENLRARHWEGYRKVMETGLTRYGGELLAVPARRKDGTRLSLQFRVVLLRDTSGELLGVAAIIRDVTAGWLKEKALIDRIAELEAKLETATKPLQAGWDKRGPIVKG